MTGVQTCALPIYAGGVCERASRQRRRTKGRTNRAYRVLQSRRGGHVPWSQERQTSEIDGRLWEKAEGQISAGSSGDKASWSPAAYDCVFGSCTGGWSAEGRGGGRREARIRVPSRTAAAETLPFTLPPTMPTVNLPRSLVRATRTGTATRRQLSSSARRLAAVEQHDIVVVGGGPAGLALAAALGESHQAWG